MTSEDTLKTITNAKGLVDIPPGTLLEVTKLEPKTGKNGTYGIATYSTVIKDKRSSGKVCLPKRLADKKDFTPPCLVLCMGMKQGPKGYYHNAHALPVAVEELENGVEKMRVTADVIRKMSEKEREEFMTVTTLSCLTEGCVVTYSGLRRKSVWGNDELRTVVDFQTECGGQQRAGTLALPSYVSEMVGDAGVFLYKGTKLSTDDRKYHDVYFFSDDEMTGASD